VITTSKMMRPLPLTFEGNHGTVEKLKSFHGRGLWHALKDAPASLWDYMGYGPFNSESDFVAFIAEISAQTDPYYYVIMNKKLQPVGWASLMSIHETNKSIEVGNIVFAPSLQKTPLATEAIYQLANHAFQNGARRFEWKCNNLNEPSKRAALRYGFTYEGLFRQHMIIKGKNRDTAWFSMLDSEWDARKNAFEAWLDKGNFDENGVQKSKLT
jgi:RimJ/RimL family protein N-acetyltransferase